MSQQVRAPKNITLYQLAMLVMVLFIAAGFIAFIYEQNNYARVIKNRERSIQLAAELRQSSNDLARLVRTYLITGNPLYKKQFQAVVDIRDGLRPRPKDYTLAYWDMRGLKENNTFPAPDDELAEPVALIELMREAGVTEQELQNLTRSKQVSDQLVEVENKAIRLVEENTPTDPEQLKQALDMLVDDAFMSGKAEIMRLIVETEQMIRQRTQSEVEAAKQRVTSITIILLVSGIILVMLIVHTGRHLRQVIGGSVQELQSVIYELGKGNFLNPIKVGKANENSVIGWLAKTQRKLAALNLVHFKAIVDSSDDAIVSKTTQGIVASWNRGAEKIFGYTADEIIGKPMTTIIPRERLHEEPEILRKISRGEKVDHFITQRQHKNGHLVDISVTISPIYNQQGEIIGASKIARDISAAVAAEAEIKRLAFFDALTGLANRRLLHDRLNQMHAAAVREKTCLMVIFIDLDNFKPLNDSRGHEAGDELLKEAARRLKACVRQSDTVARFGGDEFVILLRGPKRQDVISIEWADGVLAKLRETLNQPYLIADTSHICTPSIGISQLMDDNTRPEDLLKQADQAMYLAKRMGKNMLKVYSEEPCNGIAG